jgi:hypothetical protein
MTKISMKSRQEVIKRYCAKYKKSTKKEKSRILDSVCLTTGLSRDRAKKLLCGRHSETSLPKKKKRGRKTKYGGRVRTALKKIWALMDFACGKRLAAGMEGMLDALLRFGELDFDKDILGHLREISPATIDCLYET